MATQNNYAKTDHLITRITAVLAGIIAIVLAIWGIHSLLREYALEETNDAQVEEYINPVTARVSGFIREVRYEENQDVKKGDTLVVIDDREYQLQQAEAAAAVNNAREQMKVTQSNISTAGLAAQVSSTQITAARAKLVRAQQEYDRYKTLFEEESATQQQMENVKTALDVATAEYQATVNGYQASLSKINDNKAQLAPEDEEIKRRQVVLSRRQLDVDYTVIVAPYDGKMGRRTIQPGQQIQVGQTLAFIVNQETGKWVIANFKETQVRYMHIGQHANITTDAYPGRTFGGTIVSLSPATGSRFSLLPPDNATGNFVKIVQRIPVRILLDKRDRDVALLTAGMNANVAVSKKDGKHE